MNFNIDEKSIHLKVGRFTENIIVNYDELEVGEGTDSFVATVINPFLHKAGVKFQFYEMPPDDETASLIFVKPEKYKTAIEKGLIPDFMGYYAVNY